MSDETSTKLYRRNTTEENKKVLENAVWRSPEEKALIRMMKEKFGADITNGHDKNFPIAESNFSWQKVKTKLIEADSVSSFTQVLRAGVQNIVNSAYQSVPTTFDQWVHVAPSSKDTELYAPLQGITFPAEVGKQEKYIESAAAGLDISLRNRKYGQVYAVEKELLEDDQTGQFKSQMSLIGEYLKQVLEVLSYGKLASVANMSYGPMKVYTTETKPVTEAVYPWAPPATPLVGGGVNRPTTYTALTQAGIQAGFIALMNQLNLLSLKMNVDPDKLLISPHYRFDAGVLLNSAWYPSGASSAGVVGGAFANNELKGIADLVVSRFMFNNSGSVAADSKAWYLVDSKKPWFIAQVREGAKVTQENPESGESFDRDVIRFKGATRCNADIMDPRFAYQGNDGSV